MTVVSEAEKAETADPAGETDEVLLARVAVADRAALAEIFRRYAGRIAGFLIRSGAARDEAEEVSQDVMVTIWRKAAQFDPARAGAATWIFTIARNRRIDRLRRAARPEPDPEDPMFRPDPEPTAEAGMAAAERDRAVRSALVDLPAEQLEIVRLAFFAGLSHGEIAGQLSLPLGTVKSRLRLAFGRLRHALGVDFAAELKDD